METVRRIMGWTSAAVVALVLLLMLSQIEQAAKRVEARKHVAILKTTLGRCNPRLICFGGYVMTGKGSGVPIIRISRDDQRMHYFWETSLDELIAEAEERPQRIKDIVLPTDPRFDAIEAEFRKQQQGFRAGLK